VTSYLALSPVSVGLYTILNVAALTALAPGGVGDDIAQSTGYPFVLYEVDEEDQGGFGSKAGTVGAVHEVGLRVHVFSQFDGLSEAQGVLAKVIELLKDPFSVTGYSSWFIRREGKSVNLGDQIVAGQKVKELVQDFRLFVETT
jgi:hypothetical protein